MKATLLLLLVACGRTSSPSVHGPHDEIPQNKTDAPFVPPPCTAAPPECLPAAGLIDLEGRDLAPSLAGKVVILEYWATWCHPCKAEVPWLNAAAERGRDRDVEIVGIATESLAADAFAQAVRDFDILYPVLPMDAALADLVHVPHLLPTGYVFDKHGYRRDTHVGAWDEVELTETIDRLLAEP